MKNPWAWLSDWVLWGTEAAGRWLGTTGMHYQRHCGDQPFKPSWLDTASDTGVEATHQGRGSQPVKKHDDLSFSSQVHRQRRAHRSQVGLAEMCCISGRWAPRALSPALSVGSPPAHRALPLISSQVLPLVRTATPPATWPHTATTSLLSVDLKAGQGFHCYLTFRKSAIAYSS